MPRAKPFSGKQKKQQLKDKKSKKQDGPAYLAENSDSDTERSRQKKHGPNQKTSKPKEILSKESILAQLEVQKINEQPVKGGPKGEKFDINSFRLHFFKESEEKVQQGKRESRVPVKLLTEKHVAYSIEDAYPPTCKLDFPKRQPWSYELTKEQLDQRERQYFKNYVLDILDQPRALDLSYFELNLETWRQLWRVLELSDVLLVIADIRYPALHIPPSLINHILKELHKQVIIILNKVDFAPPVLALAWKRYLHSVFPGIHVIFFSSYPRQSKDQELPVDFDPSAVLYKRAYKKKAVPVGPSELLRVCTEIIQGQVDLSSWEKKIAEDASYIPGDDDEDDEDESDKSDEAASNNDAEQEEWDRERFENAAHAKYKNGIVTIGCLGYPNVGKSSVLNALMGKKVVSVSKTPGHTKHLQTIFICPTVRLCDCPGLVFPSMVPKALQIIAGIYPVAQVREPYSVVGFLAQRIDIPKLLKLSPPDMSSVEKDEESGQLLWSAHDICEAWAIKNGFTTSKAGRPDVYRAANSLLRLAVDGQLCLCFRPPKYKDHSEQLLSDPETNKLSTILANKLSDPKDSDHEDKQEESEAEEDEEEEESNFQHRGMFDKLQELDDDDPT
ncbi:guanine nucleotide-binding protein-like 1 [Biomphalaria glabrata]|uniref:Guanine nucleotide-binding protein-like 1 n=1 Tax=Biomphalaria glabrata TaxID=6526 RepID=A0A9U8E598_BIOGL|nr:guanine nucleotide-binding protein-like 1 [Biomphalaria glabrata]